jgi:hypothetical protein
MINRVIIDPLWGLDPADLISRQKKFTEKRQGRYGLTGHVQPDVAVL